MKVEHAMRKCFRATAQAAAIPSYFLRRPGRSPRQIVAAMAVLLTISCNGESPTAPTAQPPTGAVSPASFVSGVVFSSSGACVPGAVVELLDGPKAGLKSTQKDCDVAGDGGYVFRDLPNIPVRVRASRDGYQSQENTIPPAAENSNYRQLNFNLAPVPAANPSIPSSTDIRRDPRRNVMFGIDCERSSALTARI